MKELRERRRREVLTPEGVPLRFEIAARGERLAAFALDGTAVLLACALLVLGTLLAGAVLATAALALGQIEEVIRAIRGHPDRPAPATLSATLEFDVVAGSITSRYWPRHPRCPC